MQQAAESPRFVRRFEAVRAAARRMHQAYAMGWLLCLTSSSIIVLAAADYAWELPWKTRAVLLAGFGGLVAVLMLGAVVRPLLYWNQQRTARAIESRFLQLGQRVRTILQYAGRAPAELSAAGVTPTLVAALTEDTERRAQTLALHSIAPRRQAVRAFLCAVFPAALLFAGMLLSWQWRLAVGRVFLSNRPYTTLQVSPGNRRIDQGQAVTLQLTIRGRTDGPVALMIRPADTDKSHRAVWQEQQLTAADIRERSPDGRTLTYAAHLDDVRAPFDYRFRTASLTDQTYHVTLRYPLAITSFTATLTPPRYTGLQPKTVKGGSVDIVAGSTIEFRMKFDRRVRAAHLLLQDPPYKLSNEQTGRGTRLLLHPSDTGWTASLRPDEEQIYSVVAVPVKGIPLPKKQYWIRILPDQPPTVRFEHPPEVWEVNPIAEIPMRVRITDDFGIQRAGIVFQIDDGDEHTLLTRRYNVEIKLDARGQAHLTTHAVLEKLLCLEQFPVSETSAVTYYAYVEDNHPGTPHRVETDLRFIEIRPFERFFRPGGT